MAFKFKTVTDYTPIAKARAAQIASTNASITDATRAVATNAVERNVKKEFPDEDSDIINEIKRFITIGSKSYTFATVLSSLGDERYANKDYEGAAEYYELAIEYNNEEGYERIEAGEISNRTQEEKQKNPGDAEAVEGMGSISSHKGEHLMPTDKGVMIYRRRIKKLSKDLEEGKDPPQPQKAKGQVVRTNGQDTILKAPKKNNNDKEYVKSICSSVMNMQFDLEDMPLKERDNDIIKNLQEMEARGSFD